MDHSTSPRDHRSKHDLIPTQSSPACAICTKLTNFEFENVKLDSLVKSSVEGCRLCEVIVKGLRALDPAIDAHPQLRMHLRLYHSVLRVQTPFWPSSRSGFYEISGGYVDFEFHDPQGKSRTSFNTISNSF